MILEQYDSRPWGILRPDHVVRKREDFPKTVVFEFSRDLIHRIAVKYGGAEVAHLVSVAGNTPVLPDRLSRQTAGYQSVLDRGFGLCEQYGRNRRHGAENIFVCGECGVLDGAIEDARLIIPTAAVRDEGTSYHYLPPSDEIEMDSRSVSLIEEVFREKGLQYIKGKLWTTDAPYRETTEKMERRKAGGCIAVDMECSALAAFARLRGIRHAQFVYAADNLDAEEWEQRGLTVRPVEDKARIFEIALECASRM